MADRITPQEVFEEIEDGKDILLLDVRRASWDESDVKAEGALRIDPDELEENIDKIPKGKDVVAYCT